MAPDLVGTALTYDDEDNGYSGFVTLFVQSLFGGRDQEDRLAAVALVPDMPMTVRQVTRTVFSKENVKLRIYYTRARGIAN